MAQHTDITTTYPLTPETINALWRLQKIILDTLDFNDVVTKIVNSILTEAGYLNLGYRILVLTLVDEKRQVLQRVALSQTEEARQALAASAVPFEKIEIPLTSTENYLIKALTEKKPFTTHYWPDIFRPVLTPEQALANQHAAGIQASMLYPLLVKEKAIGVMIFSMVKHENEVTAEEKDLIARFTDIVGLAVQNAQLYSSLQAANERLKSLDQLKDEFVSLASHELRTPMTAIKSYAWMLLNQRPDIGSLTPKQQAYAQRVYISTERLINLVNDMLNISRIESGRLTITPKPFDLIQLIQEVLTEVSPTAQERQVTMRLLPPPASLIQVFADPDKIKEVLINLIGNSLKFTPAGGSITLSCLQTETLVTVNVVDTGKGIKPEDRPRLFQKFGMIEGNYLTRVAGQGSGLGLYLSKSLIELQGGTIALDSEGENRGTTATFTLPVNQEAFMQEKQPAAPVVSASTLAPFPATPQG